jgi:hypothetical protein
LTDAKPEALEELAEDPDAVQKLMQEMVMGKAHSKMRKTVDDIRKKSDAIRKLAQSVQELYQLQ